MTNVETNERRRKKPSSGETNGVFGYLMSSMGCEKIIIIDALQSQSRLQFVGYL